MTLARASHTRAGFVQIMRVSSVVVIELVQHTVQCFRIRTM